MTEPAKPRMRDGLIKRGEWRYFVLDEPRDPATGRRRQKWVKGGRTRKEAEAARDDARDRSRNRGGWRAPTRTVLGDYLTGTWLPSIRAKVAPSTFTSYRQNLAHVAGRIGHVRLDALDAPTLDALYADLEARGLARSTVRLLHTQLHRALADAVRWDLLVRNPADLVDPPKPTRRVLTTWTADQLRTFLAGVAGDQLAALYQLAGVRHADRGTGGAGVARRASGPPIPHGPAGPGDARHLLARYAWRSARRGCQGGQPVHGPGC